MVCPVLLAIALKKVDLKSEEHGRGVPTTMLVVATVTLLAGICPFLICCFSKRFFRGSSSSSPHIATMLLAPLSSTCLVALACWVIYLILHSWVFPVIGALIGLCSVIRTVTHFTTAVGEGDAATRCEKYCNRLESSLDFLAGITALLFLGLEGLALEGQINSSKAIIQDRLTKPMGTSFIVCVVGVGLMLLETMPPRKLIRNLTETIDILTGFAVSLVMFFIMYALMELRALLLLVAPFLILMMYVFYAATSKEDGKGNNNHRGAANGDEESPVSSSADGDKPASLELTKVTFTGFLAVSIPSISRGSVNMSTECFLHLAAAAIVSGLVWRLLTHYKS
jgi:hypothetical protein